MSPLPCLCRVREIETAGVIRQYVALLEPSAVGIGASVFAQVSLERQIEALLDAFEEAVRARPEVVECYFTTGNHDYLLRIVVPDLNAYRSFVLDHLSKAPGVANIKVELRLEAGEVLDRTAARTHGHACRAATHLGLIHSESILPRDRFTFRMDSIRNDFALGLRPDRSASPTDQRGF